MPQYDNYTTQHHTKGSSPSALLQEPLIHKYVNPFFNNIKINEYILNRKLTKLTN